MMKKDVLCYPKEYLTDAFIAPKTMRKHEVAELIDLPWQIIKNDIREDKDLHSLMAVFNYKRTSKYLYQTHVAILFNYYGAPLATTRNKEIYEKINEHNVFKQSA